MIIFLHFIGDSRAELTIVPVVPWEPPTLPAARGPRYQLPNFYQAVLTFECVNVQCGLKRNEDD